MGIAAIRRKASIHRTTGKASAFASAMSGALAILSLKNLHIAVRQLKQAMEQAVRLALLQLSRQRCRIFVCWLGHQYIAALR